MISIAVVFHNYLRGGAETVVEALCRQLRRKGCHIELFTNSVADNARTRAAETYDRVNTFTQPVSGFGDGASAAIAAEIAPMKPDVIWLIGDDYDGLDQMRAVLKPGGRLVFALHSVPFFQVRLKTRTLLKRLRERLFHSYSRRYAQRTARTLAEVDSYVVLCRGYADRLSALYPGYADKIRVIYNPTLPAPAPKKPTKTIACVSRLSAADKRIDNLLRIFSRVNAAHPDWRLRIIGDGPDRTALEVLCRELNLTAAVDFCGYQPQPDLDGAQIICLTSDIEGWGMALIEGMQQGAVPVAFNCSEGVSEILADGRGIAVEPGDLEGYASALNELISSPAMRKQMVDRAKPFLKSLSLENAAGSWLALFRQ